MSPQQFLIIKRRNKIKCQTKFKQKLFLPQRRILRNNTRTVSDNRTILEGKSDRKRRICKEGVETEVEKRFLGFIYFLRFHYFFES